MQEKVSHGSPTGGGVGICALGFCIHNIGSKLVIASRLQEATDTKVVAYQSPTWFSSFFRLFLK